MHLPLPEISADPAAQRARDHGRIRRALTVSLAFVLALFAIFSAQVNVDLRALMIAPHAIEGLPGIVTAPLLHGSFEHVVANAVSLLLLGTLAGSVYPRATLRALPLIWIASGACAWLLGEAGSHHLGASGITHGLMFLVFVLGLLRRDRAAIASAMIAFMLYGGMLLTVLPQEPGVSWQAHLGGAIGGIVAAFLFRRRDPEVPRKKYSWDIEDELAVEAARLDREQFEPPHPREVPVLWQRGEARLDEDRRGVVLPFRARSDE